VELKFGLSQFGAPQQFFSSKARFLFKSFIDEQSFSKFFDLLKTVNNKIFNGARIVKNENLNLVKLNPTLSFK
jgi:hypothetical protein